MRIPRLYVNQPLQTGGCNTLDADDSHYLKSVLRLRPGAELQVFNGEGSAFQARLMALTRKQAQIEVDMSLGENPESPLQIELGLCISRAERMDYAVQKAVELGVNSITPLLSRRCVVRLNEEKKIQRRRHWQAIARHACEQCGRNRLPSISPIQDLQNWLDQVSCTARIVLAPESASVLGQQARPTGPVALLIGPEGGLSPEELADAQFHEFIGMRLGPRVLRTETAVVVGLAALQLRWGDLET